MCSFFTDLSPTRLQPHQKNSGKDGTLLCYNSIKLFSTFREPWSKSVLSRLRDLTAVPSQDSSLWTWECRSPSLWDTSSSSIPRCSARDSRMSNRSSNCSICNKKLKFMFYCQIYGTKVIGIPRIFHFILYSVIVTVVLAKILNNLLLLQLKDDMAFLETSINDT